MRTGLLVLGIAVTATGMVHPVPVRAQLRPVPTVRRLVLPPPPPPAPPPGISVQMQTSSTLAPGVGGLNSAPFSLGMASNFSLETTPPASSPNEVYGHGSIQFAAGNDLALWVDQAATQNVRPKLIITNATPQGTVVYTMSDVFFVGTQAGSAISTSIQYRGISWTFTYANGQAPVSGGYFFGNNRK
jgi:hypothetical protein